MLRTDDVTVDGVRSPVLQGGPLDAQEAVVFVHGNPGFSEDWRGLSERLSEFARTIAPDMPGYGNADKPDTFDYTVDGYARHLDGLLAKLGVRRVHLVLHDFGGAWGLTWAATHTTSLASLTLINIGVMPGYRWHFLARIWRTPVLGEIFMATTTRFGFKCRTSRPTGASRCSAVDASSGQLRPRGNVRQARDGPVRPRFGVPVVRPAHG